MLKRSTSTSSRKELNNTRSNSLRKINFSVPTICESSVEQKIINENNSITSLDSTNSRYARTTVILEMAENHRSYSECETSETNIEETTSGYCTAETAESATKMFTKLSLKKKHRILTKPQIDSRIGKRKSCCCCKLPLCPIDNYADEDKENTFCQTLSVEERLLDPSTRSSTTFRLNSSEEDMCPCVILTDSHRAPCRESDSEDETQHPMTLIQIAILEELCECLLKQMCTSTGGFAPPEKVTPKKARSVINLSCKDKTLKYPKPKPKFCFIHKEPSVPNICLKRRVHDTVDLYQYYNCQWKHFRKNIPTIDMDPRRRERWLIREKFLKDVSL